MAWTYRTKYSITTVLIPPSTPSPKTPAGAASPAAPQPSLSAAMGLNAHIASLGEVTRAAQAWWQRDPRRQPRTKAAAHQATSQSPDAPWNTSQCDSHQQLPKRKRESQDSETDRPKSMRESSTSEQMPEETTTYLASDISDLLTRLIDKGLIKVEGETKKSCREEESEIRLQETDFTTVKTEHETANSAGNRSNCSYYAQ